MLREFDHTIAAASPDCNGSVTTGAGPVPDYVYYQCGKGHELVAGAPLLDKDTCNGDSVGPIFLKGPDGNLYLAGATSRAVVRGDLRRCGDGGIYARMDSRAVEWIRAQGGKASLVMIAQILLGFL